MFSLAGQRRRPIWQPSEFPASISGSDGPTGVRDPNHRIEAGQKKQKHGNGSRVMYRFWI